jgi:hypothetical protein
MLRHLKFHDKADQIQNAILNTIAEGKYRTADLGGSSSTTDFTKAICDHLWRVFIRNWFYKRQIVIIFEECFNIGIQFCIGVDDKLFVVIFLMELYS